MSNRHKAVEKIGFLVVEKNINQYLGFNDSEKYTFKIKNNIEVNKRLSKHSGRFATYAYCDYIKREIVLNELHLEKSSLSDICDSILHECGHAVACKLYGDTGHGRYWKRVVRAYGISDKATTAAEGEMLETIKSKSKYRVIAITDDNEVLECSYANRKWKKEKYDIRFVKGMKAKTIGKLWMVKTEDYEAYKNNVHVLKTLAFR